MEVKEFDRWEELQEHVELRWGLSPEQRRGAFYSMRPARGESFEHFVQRVEDERAQLHLDDELCLRTFWPLVPREVQQRLDLVHTVHMTMAGQGMADVSWARVVEVCWCKGHSFAALAGVTAHTAGSEAAQPEASLPPPPPPVAAHVTIGRPDAVFKVDVPCKLCHYLKSTAKKGDPMSKIAPERHSFEECYTNPLSSEFKPDTYRRRMLYLIHNKIEIPQYM